MPDKNKNEGLTLTGDELTDIQALADKAERVTRRKGGTDEEVRKSRSDTAYGAALKPIMKQGIKPGEAGDLARAVGESMAGEKKKSDHLYNHPRSKKEK